MPWVLAPCGFVVPYSGFGDRYVLRLVTSGLNIEIACFSETLALTQETTRRQNPRQNKHKKLNLYTDDMNAEISKYIFAKH
jgi:hypothetical protein